MDAIVTTNLSKKYGDFTAVNGISFSIKQGELFSLLGLNGAGKTTTIKMLTCLTKPTSGNAYLQGHSVIDKAQDIKQIINVSPQETAIAPNLTVKENLELIRSIYSVNSNQNVCSIKEMSALLGLESVLNKKAKILSGGMQRRLSIAMALISNPQILFLDEPTLGLDVIARRELWSAIKALKGKITILLTTHYLEEAEALSDKVGIMKKGNLIAIGSVDELVMQTNTNNLEEAFIVLSGGIL